MSIVLRLKKITYQKVCDRMHKLLLGMFGRWTYPSYWHYILKGSVDNPNTECFCFTARPNPGAGIGHQMANWIAGYWWAKQFGIRFAHLPFSTQSWEDFLGFGNNEPRIPVLKKKGYKVRRIPLFYETKPESIELVIDIISSYSGKRVVFLCEQDQFYRNQYGVMEEIQNKFYGAPARGNDILLYDSSDFNIAIHVRRGDIMTDPTNENLRMRYLSNDYFDKVLHEVVENFAKIQRKPIHIYIFSQGILDDFPEFKKYKNIHWCMDMAAQDSFLHMVYADVLITSKSSFSYKPALLNKNGIKVCPRDFWHGYPDSKDWILCDNKGNMEWK